ncbi:PEP-CTERM system histidine kinase PrsK [Pseudomaricurvus alkylphenolicus]|uniref:XrtA/PEP-CTERM system histidine kinase PrsK n=1 Tax=Pseudomaricurvus alkylphenolicus TaxID=1306991 RepID=UPI0014233824|nr:XrtA/PEP-CTERM system histidine kinase PrsK [Pseudomaricurvus alkylphenolicus]NIB43148.1 PEP-CTERM system histidine kinase PrsK [Pseudomaricurvus alkylphenolicus]
MPLTVQFYAFLLALIGYLLLSGLLAISYLGRPRARVFLLATGVTGLWAGAEALRTLDVAMPPEWFSVAELMRNVAWLFFLYSLINDESDDDLETPLPMTRVWIGGTVLGICVLLLLPVIAEQLELSAKSLALVSDLKFVVWLGMSIAVLVVTEQLIRHSNAEQRWSLKYLCLGTGSIYAVDFYIYADALLFKHVNPELQSLRAIAGIMAIPLFAITAARSSSLQSRIHVSRHIVFHSFAVVASGIYLIAMAAAGYYIRYFGGIWGGFLQLVFLLGAGLLLATLLFSEKIRMQLRVFLSKHFFSYKYDYRQEWLRFTDNLANMGGKVPDRTCQAIAELIQSPGALLWTKSHQGDYELASNWNMAEPETPPGRLNQDLKSVVQFLQSSYWVVDLEEYSEYPQRYEQLELPTWLTQIDQAWLIVPLIINNDILGLILLKKSSLRDDINWEDRDLLKMAGKQAAIHVAQYRSEMALVHARQFEAFNRLSAYVMHDLKNILAQQSLIVANAAKHKNNPRFVDDMILTVENSVNRMNRLLEQMKQGARSSATAPVALRDLLQRAADSNNEQQPTPTLLLDEHHPVVTCDREQLLNVVNHLVQNAQEATPDDGSVSIALSGEAHQAHIDIIDNGCGMTPGFVRERLFKPFDTTKGLTGMGIGAFESRNYIQSLNGSLSVDSEVGQGTKFRVTLPCVEDTEHNLSVQLNTANGMME